MPRETPARRPARGRRRKPSGRPSPAPPPAGPARPANPGSGRRAGAALLALPVLLYALLWVLLLDTRPSPAGDNVLYLLLARSLAEGRGLTEIHLPEAVPHTKYAFAFPAFLAPAWALTGGSLTALKVLIGVTGAAAVVLAQILLRRRGRAVGLAAALMLAASPLFLEFAGDTFSEVPFLAATLLSLLLFEASGRGRGTVPLALALAAAAAGTWIRLIGGALPAAYAVALWRTGRRGAAAGALVALAVGVAAWVPSFRSGGGYVAELAARYEMADRADSAARARGQVAGTPRAEDENGSHLDALRARIAINAGYFLVPGGLGRMLAPWSRGARDFAPILLTLLTLAALAVFWGPRLRSDPGDPVPAYVLLTLAVLLVWSAPVERFFLPLLPFVALAALAPAERAGRKALTVAAVLLCASQIAGVVPRVVERASAREGLARGNEAAGLPGPYAQLRRTALWARTLPPGAVLAARKPQVVFFHSGLRAVTYPRTADPREFAAELVRLGADYLLADQQGRSSTRYLAPFYRAYAAKLPLAFETGEPFNTVVLGLAPLHGPGGLEPAERPSLWPPPTRFPMRRPPPSS